jgi:hypothetical protein
MHAFLHIALLVCPVSPLALLRDAIKAVVTRQWAPRVLALQDKNVSLTEANTHLDAKLHEAQAAYSRAQLTQARWAAACTGLVWCRGRASAWGCW